MNIQIEEAITNLKNSEYALLFTMSKDGEHITTSMVKPRTREGDAYFLQVLLNAFRYTKRFLDV